MALSIPTFGELYGAMRAEVQARSGRLRDWQPGSVLDALTGGAGVLADQVVRYALHRFDALFLDRAEKADLDALVADRFDLARHAARASEVRLDLARDGHVGDLDLPAGTPVLATLAGGGTVAFETVDAVFHGSADAGPWPDDVLVRSVDTGRATNVPAAGTAWRIDDVAGTSLASPDDVALTADEDAAGGRDVETDEALRSRARLYYTTLVRGTVAALRTGALSVPGVAFATVRERVEAGDLDTFVYVADASGSSNSLLEDAVRAALEDWRAAGRSVMVEGASVEHVALTVALKVRAGSDVSALEAAARSAVVAYFDGSGPAVTVYLSDVEHEVHLVSEDVRAVDVSVTGSPSVREVTPAGPADSLRVLAGAVTVTTTEVP